MPGVYRYVTSFRPLLEETPSDNVAQDDKQSHYPHRLREPRAPTLELMPNQSTLSQTTNPWTNLSSASSGPNPALKISPNPTYQPAPNQTHFMSFNPRLTLKNEKSRDTVGRMSRDLFVPGGGVWFGDIVPHVS